MTNPTGSFIWYELMTADVEAATRFYGKVVGWTILAPDAKALEASGGVDYRMITRSDGGSAGGVLKLNADMIAGGAKPTWLGYLFVKDVDAALSAIAADGGRTIMPKQTLPVGQIAMVMDPMGTPFYVMTPVPPPGKPEAVSDVFDPRAAQRVRWNELTSPDLARAKAFYAKHFAFQMNDVMPMGPLGDYVFIDHGGTRVGAMMQKPAEGLASGWLFYIGVPSILAAEKTVVAEGGTIDMGPHEVPGGDWILVGTDPSGARFGLVGPRGG